MAKFSVLIRRERCKACGLCLHFCKFDVLDVEKEVNSQGYLSTYVANPDNCTGCTNCYLVCPDLAIEIIKNDEGAQS